MKKATPTMDFQKRPKPSARPQSLLWLALLIPLSISAQVVEAPKSDASAPAAVETVDVDALLKNVLDREWRLQQGLLSTLVRTLAVYASEARRQELADLPNKLKALTELEEQRKWLKATLPPLVNEFKALTEEAEFQTRTAGLSAEAKKQLASGVMGAMLLTSQVKVLQESMQKLMKAVNEQPAHMAKMLAVRDVPAVASMTSTVFSGLLKVMSAVRASTAKAPSPDTGAASDSKPAVKE